VLSTRSFEVKTESSVPTSYLSFNVVNLAILKPFIMATKRLEGRPKEGRFGAV
jgi:hypothetical protein